MSVFFKASKELRAVSPGDWSRDIFSPSRTVAGVQVTPDKAMRGSLWTCTHFLASLVAGLPVDVVRGSGASKQKLDRLPQLVASPSGIVKRRAWVYQGMMSLLLYGNAYGYVVSRDALGFPTTVEWLHPTRVRVKQESSLDRPTYVVNNVTVPSDDIVHLAAFLQPGSAVGLSPVEYHAETLGISIAARDYAGGWFGGGAHPTALLQNKEKTIELAEADKIKTRFLSRKKREPLVVGSDWGYTPLQIPAAQSGFIETMGYTSAETAKIFGPALAELLDYTSSGSSLTYTNRIDLTLNLLNFTALQWIQMFEDFWTDNLPKPQTARMNVNGLLRVDPKTRMEMHRTSREIGLRNIDEIRDIEDEPPLPDGIGSDYSPLKLMKEGDGNGAPVSQN